MLTKTELAALQRKLRKCQRDSIAAVEQYLSRSFNGKSMLVCLPTGAGKTGVIATVCQSRATGRTLVLSPRKAVCDQLVAHIGGKFFSERGIRTSSLKTVGVIGSKGSRNSIVVDTFQKVVRMTEAKRGALLAQFDLVIVDEGHSEPAPIWGRIIRSMKCHKIIITATPYRNDLFQFDIGPINFCLSFKDAVKQKVIVDPVFSIVPKSGLVARVKKWLRGNPDQKCIVKCDEFSDLLEAFREFRKAGVSSVAFHDQFSKIVETGGMVDVPPDIAGSVYRVLLHQHKLDEGVDIPSAKLLVLTYPVTNGRELVQTTGRVVRATGGRAQVWDCTLGSNTALWTNYRAFDEYISDDSAWQVFIKSLDSATLIEAYLTAFPKISYFGQNFRTSFNLEKFEPDKQLKLPLASFCFMEVDASFTTPLFVDALLWQLRGRGELVKAFQSSHGPSVVVSVTFDNSSFLRDELFFQPRIEAIVAKQVGEYLAVFDSRSVDHSSSNDLRTGRPIDVRDMLKLAGRDTVRRTRETHASAVGTTRLRAERVSQRGRDLEENVATQSNAGYALSIAKVDNLDNTMKRTTSYYLGVGSGRVADQRKRNFSLESVSAWIDEIAAVMGSRAKPQAGLLTTFSLPIANAMMANIESVTLDLSDLDADVLVSDGSRRMALAPGFYFESVRAGTFKLGPLSLVVAPDAATGKLIFSADRDYRLQTDLPEHPAGSPVVDWLNEIEVKALLDNAASYFNGKYYLLSLPTEAGFKLEDSVLGRQLVAVGELQSNALTEKGVPVAGGFSPDSIFGLLDELILPIGPAASLGLRQMQGGVAGSDIVYCMDMGTEAADFVFCSPQKLVYVHAKCGSTRRPKSSAGALAEVGSQATKNIEQLISKNLSLPFGNQTRMLEAWPSSGTAGAIQRLRVFKDANGADRLRGARSYSALANEAIRTLVTRRASDACQKEIWIVVGRAFSLGHFKRQMLVGSKASSESLQAYQLITAWSAAARDNDVALRFFVSP